MQNDGDIQLQAAIDQMQQAFEYSRKQRNDEIKIWQKKTEELESQLSFMQQTIQQLESEKNSAESELGEALAQNENLKAQNASLMQALQEKEDQISKFLDLNQNLKNLIDQTSYIPQETSKVSSVQFQTQPTFPKQSYSTKQSAKDSGRYLPPETLSPISKSAHRTANLSARRTASKSSLFIKAAKEELPPNDFNHMISEINMYNKKTQSREETITNVKRLLGSAHRSLFDQFLPMVSGM